jgi:putative ABC transport system permease protein
MRSIRFLNLRRLREQPVRSLLAVVAIAAGTTLLVAVLIDRASVNQSFDEFVTQRAGPAKLEVHGPGGPAGLDERVLPKVVAVPGVKAAVPMVQVVTVAETAAGRERLIPAFGVDCSVQAIVGEFGCDSGQLTGLTGAFVTSPRLAHDLGDGGFVRSDEGRIPIANAFPVEQLDAMNNGNIAVFPLADAQHLFGHQGALTSILVVPEHGVSLPALRHDLAAVIGPQNLVDPPGTIGGTDFASTFISMLLLMSLFGLAIGAQLVHNTVTLSLEERRRDLAVVGAIGAPRRILLVGTLVESGILGAIGGLLGVVGGVVVARPLVDGMSNSIDDMTGLRLGLHVSPFAVAAGIVLGIGTSLFAAYGPARRASRMDVAAELHGQTRRDETHAAARGRRAAVYVVLALFGCALAYIGQRGGAIETWQPSVALLGFGLTAFLSFRAAQHGAAPVLALVGRVPAMRNGTARVAITNLAGEPKRTGVMIMALAAAVGTGVVLGNINGSITDGTHEFTTNDVLWGETLSANNSLGIAAKPTAKDIAAIEATPGVGEVLPVNGFCGEHPSVGIFCVSTHSDSGSTFPFFRGRRSVADVFAHHEVLIGTALARTEHLRPGDTFQLPGRDGMHALEVGAIWGDPDNTGRGITMTPTQLIAMYGNRPADEVRISAAPGVPLPALERRLEAQHIDPDLKIVNGAELSADLEQSIKGFVTPFIALQRGMLVVALIAVTSTLLLVGVQRRREHGLLLAVGMAPVGLGRMVLMEAGIVGVAASVLGTLAGIVTYIAMMWVSPLLTGLSAPFHFELTGPFLYGTIGLVFVLLGAAVPAWRTSRLDPAVALRYE